MKCLITGGAGFIGSHLADRLIAEGCAVTVVDNLSSGKKENLNPEAGFHEADVRDKNIGGVIEREKPDVVFHYAAHIEARESMADPVSDAGVNILGSLNVLEGCRKAGVKKIIFASSGGEIYGSASEMPTPETYLPAPLSPYGVAKFSVEKYLDSYRRLFGLSYLAARYANVYGPRQNPNGEAGVVAIFTGKMLKGGQPLIHGDGRQTKDYIFIEDAVEATVSGFKKGLEGVLNVGTGKEASVMEIFNKIRGLTGSSCEEKHVPLPACGFERGCLSIGRAEKELGWRPKHSLDQGLEKTVEWFKEGAA